MLIGNTERAGHILNRVVGALLLPDGLIAVANRGTGQIRVFDNNANMVAEMGGPGGGPKKFALLYSIWEAGLDTIEAFDPVNRRVSRWNPNGQFLGSKSIPLSHTLLPVGRFGNGRILAKYQIRSSRRTEVTNVLVPDSAEYFLLDIDHKTAQSIGRYPDGFYYPMRNPLLNDRLVFIPLPAGPTHVVATGPERFYAGHSSSWTIAEYSQDGSLVQTWEPELPIRERTSVDVEAWLDLAMQEAKEAGAPAGALSRYYQSFPQAEQFPAFDQMVVAQTGDLWVREFPGDGDSLAVWRVFDHQGRRQGYAETPVGFKPYQIGSSWVLAVNLGDNGIETVGLFPMRREGG